MSVLLSVCLSVRLSFSLSTCQDVLLSVCLSFCLSVCLCFFLSFIRDKQNFELEHEDFCTKESATLFQEIIKLGYEIFKPGWPLEKLRGCANKYYEMDLLLIKGRNFNYRERASFLELMPRIKFWGWESKNDYAICSINNSWQLLDSIWMGTVPIKCFLSTFVINFQLSSSWSFNRWCNSGPRPLSNIWNCLLGF